MLSFLKLVFKKWTNARFRIWRSAMAPSDAAEKNCNIDAQPQSLVHKSPKDVLENLLPVWLLWRTSLFVPSRFWTTCTNFDNCCQRYIASCRKKFYRCTSTFSALNYCDGIFFKSLSYLYEVGRTNFSVDFWTFRNFWPQFHEYCGAT